MAQYKAGIQTKNNIYFSSEKLFYENGYANTSVTNITDYAKANRGSFYHHYKNKLELGVKVYTNFANRNAKIQELFGDGISEPIRVLLSLKTYWYLFYSDEKIRRFAIDLANENILQIKEDPFVIDACLRLSNKKISEKRLHFISITNIGLSRQLNIDAYSNKNTYNYNDVSDYYMSTMMRLFDIESVTIDSIIAESRRLFSRCTIINNGFYVTFQLNH